MKRIGRFEYPGLLLVLLFFYSCSNVKSPDAGNQDSIPEYYTLEDFPSVRKIDAHMHIQNYADTVFINQAEEDNFRFLNFNVFKSGGKPIEEQQKFSAEMVKAFPERNAWVTTFSLDNFNNQGWQEEVISYIKQSVENGAVGVKVWKNIGFFLKDEKGQLVMIDHPRFDPNNGYLPVFARQK